MGAWHGRMDGCIAWRGRAGALHGMDDDASHGSGARARWHGPRVHGGGASHGAGGARVHSCMARVRGRVAWMVWLPLFRVDGLHGSHLHGRNMHARARPEKMPMAARLGMVDKYCAPDAAADLPIVLALCVVSRNGI